jgi:hypothetical protein
MQPGANSVILASGACQRSFAGASNRVRWINVTERLDHDRAKKLDLITPLGAAKTDDEGVKKGIPMPRKLPFDAAVASLHQLVEGMVPGEELVLTVQGEPKAIVTRPGRTSWPCQPGTARDTKQWMAPDFDAPLEDFAEYME